MKTPLPEKRTVQRKSVSRRRSPHEPPANPIITVPTIPRTSEIPVSPYTRQEVAPIALELYKAEQDLNLAAGKAIELLRACDKAIAHDLIHQQSDFVTRRLIEVQKEALLLTKDRIKTLSIEDQWESGAKVSFGKLVESATKTVHKRRAKKKFLDFMEVPTESAEKKWPRDKANKIGGCIEELWGYFIVNPFPALRIPPLAGLSIFLLELGLPDAPDTFSKRFSLLVESGRISKNPDKRCQFPDKQPVGRPTAKGKIPNKVVQKPDK